MRYTEEEDISSDDSDLLDIYGIAEVNAHPTMDAVEEIERPILRALLSMADAIYREAWE